MPALAMPQAKLPTESPTTFAPAKRGKVFLSALIIVLAGLGAYANSFHGPFVQDDLTSIVENPSIQGSWREALHPPVLGETAADRPLVNLSLAFNYKLGGLAVEGYHVVNLIIHLLAGLALLGLVRRTLELPSMRAGYGHLALPVALGTALLWTVHPLQTESVTYVVQRAEALMGLFYLLTLYCFVRGAEARRPHGWLALAVLACVLSGLSKEVAITIPVMVLLYDRTFVAGTFVEAWRRRWPWYLAFAGTWAPLVLGMWSSGSRGDTIGFWVGLGWWQYACMQFRAIIVYCWLSAWPHPLLFDYGVYMISHPGVVWPYALALGLLVGSTLYALWRRPKLGFLGAWVFIILAPTSSIVPVVVEPMAERRFDLPLAALTTLAVLMMCSWAGRRALTMVAVLALAFGVLTLQRNRDYDTVLGLWQREVVENPTNARAHNNVATCLGLVGRPFESIQEFKISLTLDPAKPKVENSLAFTLAATGQYDEAILHYRKAIAMFPAYADARSLFPDYAEARGNLGNVLKKSGRVAEAIAEYKLVLRDEPDSAEVRVGLGNAYNAEGQPETAVTYYQAAVARKPELEPAHMGLGNAWAILKQWDDAAKEYELALRLDPQDFLARYSLGEVLIDLGNTAAARREFAEVLREQPDFAPARSALDGLPAAAADSEAPPPQPK